MLLHVECINCRNLTRFKLADELVAHDTVECPYRKVKRTVEFWFQCRVSKGWYEAYFSLNNPDSKGETS